MARGETEQSERNALWLGLLVDFAGLSDSLGQELEHARVRPASGESVERSSVFAAAERK
jgi:hypothetical protein